jgi:pimeloyl-ACP methyl ester carboxylesterase
VLTRWLHRIALPTLVLWGERDGIVKPDYGRAYAERIPGARFKMIANAGHYPHLEQPERTAEQVRAFIDG